MLFFGGRGTGLRSRGAYPARVSVSSSQGGVQLKAPAQLWVPGHSLSGSVPGVMSAHVPLAPPVLAAEHAWQKP